MAGFFRRLFGKNDRAAEPETAAVEYKGFRIRAQPFEAGGQFQTAGTIEKDFADGKKEHYFVRAEKHSSADEAASFALIKARQIVDERGDRMFDKD